MKFPFSSSVIVYLFLTLLLSACSGLKPTTSQPEAGKIDSDSNVEKTAEGDGVTAKSVLPKAVDPLAGKDIPLKLIKAYDSLPQLDNQNTNEASVSQLQQLQVQFPTEAGPSYRLARIYFQQLDFEKALESVAQAIALSPQNYYAFNLQGVIYREQGKFELAKQSYQTAINLYPDYAKSHLNFAILSDLYLYDLEIALSHYQRYLELIGVEDKKVEGWIIDLKRRIARED